MDHTVRDLLKSIEIRIYIRPFDERRIKVGNLDEPFPDGYAKTFKIVKMKKRKKRREKK